MPLKIVMFYRQNARGWTETYYNNSSSPSAWCNQYATGLNLQNFMGMRADDVVMTEVRASLIGSPRVTYSVPLNLFSLNALDDITSFAQDTYGEDALVLLRSANNIPRHVWLRGLPNIFIVYSQETGIPTPPASLISSIAQYAAMLQTMGLCIQNAVVPTPSSGVWYPVTSVTGSGGTLNTTSVITYANLPTLSPPYPPMYFQGVPRNLLPGFPRIITPSASITLPAPTQNVPYLYRGATEVTYPPKMKGTPLSYTYPSITSAAFETYGTRKTGRPTGLPRGRASVVIKRQ
jgi:hypothetical protein